MSGHPSGFVSVTGRGHVAVPYLRATAVTLPPCERGVPTTHQDCHPGIHASGFMFLYLTRRLAMVLRVGRLSTQPRSSGATGVPCMGTTEATDEECSPISLSGVAPASFSAVAL